MTNGKAEARTTLYPGYDVLDKRTTPSWDDATRAVIAERLATPHEPRFFLAVEWLAVTSLCACVVPQANAHPVVPLAALLDARMFSNQGDGYRDARMPPMRDAWRIGLAALDADSCEKYELPFASIDHEEQIALLEQMQRGELKGSAWGDMPSKLFFSERVLHDVCGLYYSHLHAWSEIGFGGPANPLGYVPSISTGVTRGKPQKPNPANTTRPSRRIAVLDDAQTQPRGKDGRAPDVFREGAWIPMREYPDHEEVDFAIVSTSAGGGTLACRLSEQGFKVVAFDAGAWWYPLEEFASDEAHQQKLFWTDERICDGENPLKLGHNNSGKAVGGSTVHFAMVSLRFRRMVQFAQPARIRRRLAARLARNVVLLRTG
ncbi:MAG: Glucose-methanol-choline (GMC) oxidoreductase:NAD binding site [uncultured Paraburkholderia sp.]|nr:MAG: Glucose-methanol-choline (GMC) oxidoreductase:NAD binding site [uncultured Paraburkholderia sp.]CAH2938672.1 MAG: Glucose-methanol-choline (GMC) oxidoreductase:NAD binding site [uncultured Paraburkholderia sp.]